MKAISKSLLSLSLNEEEQTKLRMQYGNSEFLRAKYKELIDDKLRQLLNEMTDFNNFDKPAWSNHQAFLLGRMQAYKNILDIL